MCAEVPRPYLIGLTGNIATGKSTVGRMLAALGAVLIDADAVAHAVMVPGHAVYEAVVAAFGPEIVRPNGEIDRRRLGAMVFADAEALARLERLVHPAVAAQVEAEIARARAPVVVVEAVKLLESGMGRRCHAVWVTRCDEATQLERLVGLRGLTRAEALARIRAQPPQAVRVAQADVVIDTNGTLAETEAQVRAAWRRLADVLRLG